MKITRLIGPDYPVVDLDILKSDRAIAHSDDDGLLERLELEAVSRLDGYRGVLGRCILEQTWRIEIDCAGTYRLPLPDVVSATVDGVEATLKHDARGAVIDLSGEGPFQIDIVSKLPDDLLDTVKRAIILDVGYHYENRLAEDMRAYKAFQAAYNAAVAHVRWVTT